MKTLHYSLELFILILTASAAVPKDAVIPWKLHYIKVKISDEKGAGMSSGKLGILALGGGKFSMDLCEGIHCCSTGRLNTDDNNWERGERNFFVGRQVGSCYNFKFNTSEITLDLEHKGPNGGKLEYARLYGIPSGIEYDCNIDKKLDGDETQHFTCQRQGHEDDPTACNGHPAFCKFRFNEFTLPGSHNAGTGMAKRDLGCAFTNHDLNIKEQLEFGIRFLDIDTIYSEALPKCDGLMTGHGKKPSIGFYLCYGRIAHVLAQIQSWLKENPREIIVLNFGEIFYPNEAIPTLRKKLHLYLNGVINTKYKKEGVWPTLGEAIESGERVFVFINDEKNMIGKNEYELVKMIGVKAFPKDKEDGSVRIATNFRPPIFGTRDHQCEDPIRTAKTSCQLGYDFELFKLSVFGAFFMSTTNLDCNSEYARRCNNQIESAFQACVKAFKDKNAVINFVQADYPNYPAKSKTPLVKFCKAENTERARKRGWIK